jgi:hypothetical protein
VTHFEAMLVEAMRDMTREMGGLAERVGGLTQRVAHLEERFDESPPSSGPRPRRKTKLRDGTMILSGGTITAVLTVVLNHFAPAAPASTPLPRPPAPIVAPAPTPAGGQP